MAEHSEAKPAENTASPVAAAGAGQKPPAKSPSESQPSLSPDKLRRRIIWTCIWGYLGVNFLMFLRFFFPRTLFEPEAVFTVGHPADFSLGVETSRLYVRDPRAGRDEFENPGALLTV